MKKIVFFLPFLLVGCINDIHEESILTESMSIVTNLEPMVSTKATLINDVNALQEVFPNMVVATKDFSETVSTSALANASNDNPYKLSQSWSDTYTFASYPASESFVDMVIGDGFVSFQPDGTKEYKDVVVAVDKKFQESVELNYQHIYCTVNIIYKSLQTAHTISDIYVSGARSGKCTVTKNSVEWINLNGQYVHNHEVEGVSQVYKVNHDLGITKVMLVPLVKPTVYLKIDGKSVHYTVNCNPQPGKIINVYINDNMTFTENENAVVNDNKKLTKEPDGTYTYSFSPYIKGKTITSTVADTVKVTKHLPMDYILVLDYSSSMTNSYSDSKMKSYQAATITKVTYNDWKSNKTKYKATLNGTQYTITCTDTKNNDKVGYTTDNIHWAYITVGSDRYYITLDGGLHKSTNTNPTSSNFPKSVDGDVIYPSVGGYHYLFGVVSFASKTINNRITALQAAVSTFVDQIYADAKANGITHRICIIDFQNPKFPSYTNQQSGRATYIQKASPNYLRQCYALQYDKSTNNNAYYDNKSTTGVLFPFRAVDDLSVTSIKAAISLPYTAGCTAIDYGMYLATLELPNCRSTAEKCVVVFTDGKATHAGDAILSDCVITNYNKGSQKMSDTDVENGAKAFSQTCKNAKATVYAVSVFKGSDTPSSSFMTSLATDSSHYIDASSSSLSEAFVKISQDVVTKEEVQVDYPSLDLSKSAYLLLKFSDLFDTSKVTVKMMRNGVDVTSEYSGKITWTGKTLKISGYDYSGNFGKVVDEFYIKGLTTTCEDHGCVLLSGSGLYAADGTLIEDYHGMDF